MSLLSSFANFRFTLDCGQVREGYGLPRCAWSEGKRWVGHAIVRPHLVLATLLFLHAERSDADALAGVSLSSSLLPSNLFPARKTSEINGERGPTGHGLDLPINTFSCTVGLKLSQANYYIKSSAAAAALCKEVRARTIESVMGFCSYACLYCSSNQSPCPMFFYARGYLFNVSACLVVRPTTSFLYMRQVTLLRNVIPSHVDEQHASAQMS